MSRLLDLALSLLHRVFGPELTDGEVWQILARHKCYGLLSELSCSEAFRKEDTVNRMLNSAHVQGRYQTCAPFFGRMEDEKIPYAVHKGAVLSLALYGAETVRRSGDVDLLIRRDDADRVKEILRSEGFVQGRVTEEGIVPFTRYEILYHAANTHQLAPFVKKTGNPLCPYVNVDVNTDLMWGEAKKQIDMDCVLSHFQSVPICGIPVRKLTPEAEFIALCLHHYKDMNSLYLLWEGGLTLGLFCDLYGYLRKMAPDPESLSVLCRELSVSGYIKACISHTVQVFGAEDFLCSYLRKLGEEDLPDTFGLAEEELHRWEIPLPDRIFRDIPSYLDRVLSPEEKEKIRLNQSFM